MPVLSNELPALPFDNVMGSYTDCILMYLPNIDSWRCAFYNAAECDAVLIDDPSGGYFTFTDYTSGTGSDCSFFSLVDGEWIQDGRLDTYYPVYASLDAVPESAPFAGYPISATADLYYQSGDTKQLMLLAHSDLKNGNLTIMDSVLAGSALKTPIISTITGLLPVCLALIVGFVAIRKGISFITQYLRGA